MRYLALLFLLPLFIACGDASLKNGDGDDKNGGFGSGPLQFKKVDGSFESISSSNVTSLKVLISDSSGKTTVEKEFSFPNITGRVDQMGFNTPGTKNLTKAKKTGKVTIQYPVTGTQLFTTRTFDVYDGRYLQDSFFTDVIYTASTSLTFDWLK